MPRKTKKKNPYLVFGNREQINERKAHDGDHDIRCFDDCKNEIVRLQRALYDLEHFVGKKDQDEFESEIERIVEEKAIQAVEDILDSPSTDQKLGNKVVEWTRTYLSQALYVSNEAIKNDKFQLTGHFPQVDLIDGTITFMVRLQSRDDTAQSEIVKKACFKIPASLLKGAPEGQIPITYRLDPAQEPDEKGEMTTWIRALL